MNTTSSISYSIYRTANYKQLPRSKYLKGIILIICYCFFIGDLVYAQVGIEESNPSQMLDVNGKIKIGDDALSPTEGAIRYNAANKDFEGWNGSAWISLTKSSNGYGNQSESENFNLNGINFAYDNKVLVRIMSDQSLRVENYSNGLLTFQQSIYIDIDVDEPRFGNQIAIDNDRIIVSTVDGPGGTSENHVYVFVNQGGTWVKETIITDPQISEFNGWNGFGSKLDLQNNQIVISSPMYNDDRGRVYLYELSSGNWNLIKTFQGSIPTNDYYFGHSVSMQGNNIAISELGNNKVYLFANTFSQFGWVNNGTYTNPGGDLIFGKWVDIDNERLAVAGEPNSYIYEKNAGIWSAVPSATLNQTGGRVKLKDNNLIFIGAPYAYLYEGASNTWGKVAEFSSFDGSAMNISRNLEIADDDSVIINSHPNQINFYYKN